MLVSSYVILVILLFIHFRSYLYCIDECYAINENDNAKRNQNCWETSQTMSIIYLLGWKLVGESDLYVYLKLPSLFNYASSVPPKTISKTPDGNRKISFVAHSRGIISKLR